MTTVPQIYSPIPVAVTTTPSALLESSSAAAIARFRPTSKEIIGRIAPHVLEEHGMKRRKAQSPRQSQVCVNSGTRMPGSGATVVMKNASSPLRFSAVISWDGDRDHSRLYFEQPDHHAAIVSDIMLFPVQPSPAPPPLPAKDPELVSRLLSGTTEQKSGKTKTEKMKGRSYVQFFRSIAKFKSSSRSDQ